MKYQKYYDFDFFSRFWKLLPNHERASTLTLTRTRTLRLAPTLIQAKAPTQARLMKKM